MTDSGMVSPSARPIELASHSLASTRTDCGLFANLTTSACPSLAVSICDCAPPLMARMWPVAIKNELDTFCGFDRCSKHARDGYRWIGERGALAKVSMYRLPRRCA